MDLRSVLNANDNGDRPPVKPVAPPPQHQQQQQQHQRQASQPQPPPPQQQQLHHAQSPVQYGYRDYGRAQPQLQPHPSPGKPPSQDYGRHPTPVHHHHPPPPPQQPPTPGGSYPPPSPYQTPGPYAGRPVPPPLQPTNSYHDARSPSSGPITGPAPSPYRTPSAAGPAAGYPFPPTAEVTSPVQRHQYPPAQYQPHPQQQQPPPPAQPQHQHPRRDSFSQGAAGHAPAPYMPPHQVPQTPPVGSASASQAYIHQRSQSTHSTPTPTSAQSQHQYGPPYAHAQGSPVATARPPPQEYNRTPSQPPTPVGPPLSAASRQSSYAQPPSPYQQRISSVASAASVQVAQAQAQSSPRQAQAPPPPPPAKRISNSYESPAPGVHNRSHSHSDREHSVSVSPKTRVPSIQSNLDTPLGPAEPETKPPTAANFHSMAISSDRGVMTPAKRKLEDRDLSPKELERKEPRPPPGEVNGRHVPSTSRPTTASSSPVIPRKKRIRRPQVPIFAQNVKILGNKLPNHPNFVLQKRVHSHINGKHDGGNRASRQPSPAVTRSQPSAPPPEAGPQDMLGPWEPCITGVKPYEEMSKIITDFLFINVVNSPDLQEITSRGIQFEIEAKLGTLIDKDTNHRVDRLLDSECVLQDNGRIAFKSSMTEAHHKFFNDFLNQMVIQTDPRSPTGANRVQVHYKHRREIDRFFELPLDQQGRIPGCVRSRIASRKNVRVRVTYDQKSGDVLGKIIKARVADINVHLPTCPMDCRISINLEMDWEGSVEELESFSSGPNDRNPDRNKDRLSYKHGHYQIDLTQVTQTVTAVGGTQKVEKEHELEIELASGILLEQGRRALDGRPHRYPELVEGFLDNVRALARRGREVH